MSKKKRQEEKQAREHAHPTETPKDLLEYDPEKAKDLIDLEKEARSHGDVRDPGPDDPQHSKPGTTPGQENVPAGGTTGRGMAGGSANRRKRQ